MFKRIGILLSLLLAVGFSLSAQNRLLQGYTGFWTADTRIKLSQLFAVRDSMLPYLRNEIFARYGRPFTTAAYRNYFMAKSWYREVAAYNDSWVPANEKYNAELIKDLENPPLPAANFSQLLLSKLEYRYQGQILFSLTGRDTAEVYALYFNDDGPDSENPQYLESRNGIYGDYYTDNYESYGGDHYGSYYSDYGGYGGSDYGSGDDYANQSANWLVWGSWLILYKANPARTAYRTISLRLDHERREVIQYESATVNRTIFYNFVLIRQQ
ncbi:MAG: hypothetical protein A2087_12275 [Spirochaetes bacterium GWD1_61_31]|nr:MAG: hypothetical protein A2Y37_14955 [Spirochaetes bacterium GWB1_60_80]OHD33935.1 MAG: hypothetical protein A2004_09860 [Spirochaetes bacterium GWC1_61_12]OHD35145.1 MAG: hypothetical protein A2087_12275 [Spirochaetes bacterium GWD1_61_31]OHD41346.1 MAG: hypothetical protein A2Y35_12560 [Spirochaetes bacterium GWE1_60_18]OHD61322.1 MAG: hypothetical protein A2Y32_07005 [Spirochaetes bacterium GWF1_60_12]